MCETRGENGRSESQAKHLVTSATSPSRGLHAMVTNAHVKCFKRKSPALPCSALPIVVSEDSAHTRWMHNVAAAAHIQDGFPS